MESSKFSFTDQEFLNIINLLCKIDMDGEEYIPITSLDTNVNMDQLDSLSMIVFFIWIIHLFGISEAAMQEFTDKGKFTVRTIKEFVIREATQTYSYPAAQKYINKGNYFGEKLV